MSFNFPNSPLEGQLYTPVGGYQYVFLDGKWRVVEAPQDVGTAQTRNRIVNGAMQISQELAKGTTVNVNNNYVLDQWRMSFNLTIAPNAVCISVATDASRGVDFLRMGTNANGALAAGQFSRLFTSLEGNKTSDFRWGTASALPAVVRFDARSQILGTATFAIGTAASDMTYLADFTFTQANVWQTFTIPIPAATGGTWVVDTSQGVTLRWCIGAGTTYRGTNLQWQAVNVMATAATTNWNTASNQYFDVANVGLYLDPLATGIAPPWVMPDEAEELRACQRYWSQARILLIVTANADVGRPFPTAMRATPAVTIAPESGTGATISLLTNTAPSSVPWGFRQVTAHSATVAANPVFNARM